MYLIPLNSNNFPPPDKVAAIGPVALGSNLYPETLLKAYKLGYFPWDAHRELICWHHPDPRLILFPEKIRISKSMRPYLNQQKFEFSIDKDFENVIYQCRFTPRNYGLGSWINDEIQEAYIQLHRMGKAQSAESWSEGKLVGGLYGIRLGKVFFGESMFTKKDNASKYAFIRYTQYLEKEGVRMIDCQSVTAHLLTLGAEAIPRHKFTDLLKQWIP